PHAIAGGGDASAPSDRNASLPTSIEFWNGFYVGGHLGYAWGKSDWTADALSGATPAVSGSFGLSQAFDAFTEAGSFFEGLQIGYSFPLPSGVVIGIEADASFPSWPSLQGISIGGIAGFNSASLGSANYSENVRYFGTLRGRIGYALGSWLFYATGGFAWTY